MRKLLTIVLALAAMAIAGCGLNEPAPTVKTDLGKAINNEGPMENGEVRTETSR